MRIRSEFREVELSETAILFLEFIFHLLFMRCFSTEDAASGYIMIIIDLLLLYTSMKHSLLLLKTFSTCLALHSLDPCLTLE
jgi:hypothetical protein